ncbi:MAG: SoxR reducing system RseC family protein [Gammaproteobacteria bacterium]|nr:SoxR reducing system RseC family protein [Gammaproteobacteria bacterium]
MAGQWLSRRGRVVESDGAPVVRFTPECGLSRTGCAGHCGWRRPTAQIPVAWLNLPGDTSAGDRVVLSVAAGSLTRLAGWVFGVPLAALLAGAWLGELLAVRLALPPDPGGGIVGLAFLLAASGLVARQGVTLGRMVKLTARLERTDL